MKKSGIVRLTLSILFFLFLILYAMQLTGYNEYNQNRKNMLSSEKLKAYENDIKEGKDVSVVDYLEGDKNYKNRFSSFGLTISKGIKDIFDESMNAFFKMLEDASRKE